MKSGPLLGRSSTSRLHLVDTSTPRAPEPGPAGTFPAACNRVLRLDPAHPTLPGFDVLCLKCARAIGHALSDTTERTAP